jgi:predicted TIM-barrel fold metal-dependent hydrolase
MSFIRYSCLVGWVDWSSNRFAAEGDYLPSTNMCIDIHHHLLTPQLVDALDEHGVYAVGGEPLPSWKPETSLAVMDRVGIEQAVLSCPIPLHFLGPGAAASMARHLNDYAADCAASWPGRFRYLATLPLPDVAAAVNEAVRTLDTAGASGVVMLSNHAGVYQGDGVLTPLYDALNTRHAVVFVHPTVCTGPAYPTDPTAGSPLPEIQPSQLEFGFDATRAAANLIISDIPDRFPNIRFVFTHSGSCVPSVVHKLIDRRPMVTAYSAYMRDHGQPPPVEDLLGQLENAEAVARQQVAKLYFDTALSTAPHVLDALLSLVPRSHVLFGTDFPFGQEIGVRYTLRGIAQYPGFTDDDRTAVLHRNASHLLGGDD